MGLRESQIINSVHPWLGVRLLWLQEVARIIGGGQFLISGNRSVEKQWSLYNNTLSRPVAFPGCSQHNYGFAADAQWVPIMEVTSKGRLRTKTPSESFRIMEGHAQRAGLTTVRNDLGHLQIYPGAMFKQWAVAQGFCNPNPPLPLARQELNIFDLQEEENRFIDLVLGFPNTF